MSKFPEWRETKQKISMSERVGKLLKFMQDTACVHVEERESIAWCLVYGIINPEDEKFNKFLNEIAIPSLTKVGQARWYRDTITDLGFALSALKGKGREEDTADILEAKIE